MQSPFLTKASIDKRIIALLLSLIAVLMTTSGGWPTADAAAGGASALAKPKNASDFSKGRLPSAMMMVPFFETSKLLPPAHRWREGGRGLGALRDVLQNVVSPIRMGLCNAYYNRKNIHDMLLAAGTNAARRQAAADIQPFGGWHKSAATNINKAFGLQSSFPLNIVHQARGGGQVKTKKPSSSRPTSSSKGSTSSSSSAIKTKKKKSKYPSPLSDPEPFYPVKSIAQMTLGDVAKIFEFAVQSNRESFDEVQFKSALSAPVRSAVDAVEKAAAKSRGKDHVTIPKLNFDDKETNKPGNFDVFHFCAAMRMLSEFRMVRQVPEGAARFAVSMKLGHKDVVKNIGKIEEAAHDYIDDQKKKKEHGTSIIYSPTLRQLLQYEKNHDHHPNLPKLKEVSGAMGLLWVRRQLHFQLAFFENAVDKSFSTTSEAFQSAYARVYSKFHGRALRKIFNVSLKSAPEIDEVYNCMNPTRLQELLESPPPEEEEIASSPGQRRFGLRNKQQSGNPPTSAQVQESESGLGLNAQERRISQEMKKDAHGHMESFLQVSQPLLAELADLFDEFNMDDPKVV